MRLKQSERSEAFMKERNMKKLLILFLALMLVLLPAGSIFAQDAGTPFAGCGDLPAEECAPLVEAWQGMEALQKGANDSTIILNVKNVPGLPFEDLDIQIARTGTFEADPALVQKLTELQAMDRDELNAMMDDPAEFDKLLAALVAGLDTAQSLHITMPPELAQTLSEKAGMNIPPELTLNFVVKDGVIYINLADIAGMVPQLAMFRGWVGFQLQPLMDFIMQKLRDADTPVGPEILEFTPPGAGLVGMILAMQAPLNKYANVQSPEEITVDGKDALKYQVEMNFPGYMASPEFQNVIGPLARDYAEKKGVELNDENIEQIASVMTILAPVLLRDLKYNIDEVVGSDENVVYNLDGELDWDTSGLLETVAQLQGSEEPPVDPPPYINMKLQSDYSDFDSGSGVQAPQGAFVLPITMILSILESQ
jgi:hypothetical protein